MSVAIKYFGLIERSRGRRPYRRVPGFVVVVDEREQYPPLMFREARRLAARIEDELMSKKKDVRAAFRAAVFTRDKWRCRACGAPGTADSLDAHHIIDRHVMPHGGYVEENGISLCPGCHEKAEALHATETAKPGYAPADLFALIGSNPELARKASERLR